MSPSSLLTMAVSSCFASPPFTDCNQNGIPDEREVRPEIRLGGREALQAGSFPVSGLALDLDADGCSDLVVTNLISGDVSVLRNLGARRFAPPESMPTGGRPVEAVAADIDGDADPDLAVPNAESSDVKLLFNASNATFEASSSFAVGAAPTSAVAADLDLDGDVDLAVALLFSLHVAWNDGRGSFARVQHLPADWRPQDIAASDLDLNGRPDLVLANGLATDGVPDNVSVIFNGDRGLEPARNFAVHDSARYVLAEDFDGDADPDLAVLNAGSDDVSLLINDRDRSLQPARSFPAEGNHVAFLAADWDGDGKVDLGVAANSTICCRSRGSLQLHTGGGDGVFARGPSVATRILYGAFAGDVDADGVIDIVTCSAPSHVTPHWNLGAADFRGPPRALPLPSSVLLPPLAGDFEGDGDGDLLVWTSTGGEQTSALLVRGSGEGDLEASAEEWPAGAALRPPAVAVDLDADGDLDVLAQRGRDSLLPLVNRGGGRFEAASATEVGWLGGLVVADFDGDARLDAALSVNLGSADLAWNEGPAGFAPGQTLLPEQAALAPGDFDGDGDVDLAASSIQGLLFFANAGGRTFEVVSSSPAGTPPSIGIRAADLDGDGRTDLALPYPFPRASVLWNGGGWSFTETSRLDNPAPKTIGIETVDLDGDAALDLLLLDEEYVSLFPNRGDRRLTPTSYETNWRPFHLLPMDLAGDGMPEIGVVQAAEDGSWWLAVLANDSAPARSRDLDGDGVPDECQEVFFRRGDVEDDGFVGLTDAIVVLHFLFQGTTAPSCLDAADANDDGGLDVADAVTALGHLFRGEPTSLPEPFAACGADATADALDCARFRPCE